MKSLLTELINKLETYMESHMSSYLQDLENYVNDGITNVYCELFDDSSEEISLSGLLTG